MDNLNEWLKRNKDCNVETVKSAYKAGVEWGKMENKYNESISHIYFKQGQQDAVNICLEIIESLDLEEGWETRNIEIVIASKIRAKFGLEL